MDEPKIQHHPADTATGVWWCNVHGREATDIILRNGMRRCDPKLGGIMIPCSVVFAPMMVDKTETT